MADGLAWAMYCNGISAVLHYLDDFFFCGPAHSSICEHFLKVAIALCEQLGLPVAMEKVFGPSTTLIFLGIEIDSIQQVKRLPHDKLVRLQSLIKSWSSKRMASKHQLQQLLGHLNHAAVVVKPGRLFVHNLIEAVKRLKHQRQMVRLNVQARSDISWWNLFLTDWNGTAFFHSSGTLEVASDASGSWGCAAINKSSNDWFQVPWSQQWQDMSIAVKELFPVVVGAALWGSLWSHSVVRFNIDNEVVVIVLNSR